MEFSLLPHHTDCRFGQLQSLFVSVGDTATSACYIWQRKWNNISHRCKHVLFSLKSLLAIIWPELVCRKKNAPKQNKTFAPEYFDTTSYPCSMQLSEVARSKLPDHTFKCMYKINKEPYFRCELNAWFGQDLQEHEQVFIKNTWQSQYSMNIYQQHMQLDRWKNG